MSIKDDLLDKATDLVLELFAEVSKEGIEDVLNRDKQQRILYKSIKQFADSSYYKSEFQKITFFADDYDASTLDLSPTKTSEEIATEILPIIERCFLGGDNLTLDTIANHISIIYLQRAKLTIQLFDVAKQQKDYYEKLSNDLDDIKNTIISEYKHELNLKIEKETLLKTELNNEVTGILSKIMNHYLYFILKESPKFSGEEMSHLDTAMSEKIIDIIENISQYIDSDFCKKPIVLTIVNGLESHTKAVDYFTFSECYFRNVILKSTEKLLKYNDLIDLETNVFVLRLRNKVQSVLFPPLLEMGQTNILNIQNIRIDVNLYQKELTEIGEIILSLYHKFH